MQRKIKGTLALLMSFMMLTAFLPTAAFTESDLDKYPETVTEQANEVEAPPDVPLEYDFDEIEQITSSWDEPWDEWEEDTPMSESDYEAPLVETIESVIADFGYAYVMTTQTAIVYATPEMAEPVYTITQGGAVLLATEYIAQDGTNCVRICFITEESEILTGYVTENTITDTALWDEEVDAMARIMWAELVMCANIGELYVFVVKGEKPGSSSYDDPIEEVTPGEPVDHPENPCS